MESARPLPAPHRGAARPSQPILPPSPARPAPRFEQRGVHVDLSFAPRHRRTSMRTYLVGAALLTAVSVAGWFALGEYIYG